MSERHLLLLLKDMLESIRLIETYVNGMDFDAFLADRRTIDAVVRNIEIIGEAGNMVPEDFRLQHPEIPWKRIRGMRNRIVHEYFGIDREIVWNIVVNDLPEMGEWLETVIEEIDRE
jgi:uncharacterized protein with HEPN domain